MKLHIETSAKQVTVTREPTEKMEQNGRQKVERGTGRPMSTAALCCCTKTIKGRFRHHNRPLTWVELRGLEPLTFWLQTRRSSS